MKDNSLLIAAPMLQDYLVDKTTGAPLSAGIVTCYRDDSRTTLKNWYYQSGTPGHYDYVPLPNPLTLSAVGTIEDANGVDTIPFFYPYSEDDNQTFQPYYITVDNSDLQRQFTRQNFPFIGNSSSSSQSSNLQNYVINNVFWRNIGSLNAQTLPNSILINSSPVYYYVLAPSQHDGFNMPDFQYLKNVNGATETITFTKFDLGDNPLKNIDGTQAITPEFYINHHCTGAQLGETLKVYQFPISLHVKTLETVPFVISIQAKNESGNENGFINIYVYKFLGTGVTSPSPTLLKTLTLGDSWQEYKVTGSFPSADLDTLGNGGDDAYYIQIGMPTAVTCDIDFTLPSLYLGNDVPINNFSTYDQIDAIINSPRTGDFRTSLNSFQPYGWVTANDGSIGNTSSSATTRGDVDTWQLYNLIYTTVLDHWAPVSGGRTSPGNTTTAAYTDFSANKRLTLTRNLGRVLAGLNPVFSGLSTFIVNTGTDVLTLATATSRTLTIGTPVQVYNTGGGLPAPLAANTVYFVTGNPSTTSFQLAATLEDAYAVTAIDITTAGTGTQTIISAIGSYVGESNHQLTVPELAAHHHAPLDGGSFVTDQSGSPNVPAGTTGVAQVSSITTDTGNGIPHNTIQPTTYMNVFIKL